MLLPAVTHSAAMCSGSCSSSFAFRSSFGVFQFNTVRRTGKTVFSRCGSHHSAALCAIHQRRARGAWPLLPLHPFRETASVLSQLTQFKWNLTKTEFCPGV